MKQSIQWQNRTLSIIDQTKLPGEKCILPLNSLDDVVEAISSLRIRGAPAIGIAAAYGVVVAFIENKYPSDIIIEKLANSRPTAVNLFWALEKMSAVMKSNDKKNHSELIDLLEETAIRIHQEDQEFCRKIGQNGQELIHDTMNILTVCNTGFLATGGIGTALGVIQTAFESGKSIHVYVTETRPLLQGARLTAWELKELGIPFTLISDNMAAHVMKTKSIDCVIAGADRIALNGDSANKIGTYSLAVLAHYHQIPFYIAAPTSTIDFSINTGSEIPIEERQSLELTAFGKNTIAPTEINCYNPAFDVTPNNLIEAIITEKKVIKNQNYDSIIDLKQE